MRRALTAGHAFVALGANLPGESGSPEQTLNAALAALVPLSQTPLIISAFYESDPKDCPPGSPRYVNAVAALLPLAAEQALTLLEKLQRIELALGRIRSGIRNEARTLDLDLLSFGAVQCSSTVLSLPHPRAHERRFVLEPWVEIAGKDWLLAGRSLGHWLGECGDPPLRRISREA